MNIEYTLSIIKPDATKRNLIGKIISCLEQAKLTIVAQKMLILSRNQAEDFYYEHKNKSFFNSLISYITSGPIVVLVLKGENAVLKNRDSIGATNPAEAKEGSIRKLFAINKEQNSIHGSDSQENAKKEIAIFFSSLEIIK